MQDTIFHGSRILLGVSGGIAAYKSAEICRRIVKAGGEVQVVMTRSATEFVAPLTFETLSGRPVYSEMFERERAWEIEHIAYARWGDALLIAPATANTISKMASGLADDPLSTTVLAFRGPVVVSPAMNTAMWEHPQTTANIALLRERGVRIVEPESGDLACGEEGAGRLADAETILAALEDVLRAHAGDLAGRRVLITAGPTVEPIDPVRHVSNPSSGRMGFALAREARRRGARVTLIAGPVEIAPPPRMEAVVRVRTAREMCDAVLEHLAGQDVCVFSAAVADYAPENPSDVKTKKETRGERETLTLVRTPDVAREAAARRIPGQIFVGFAAETENLAANARAKMEAKGFDVIVANEVSDRNPAFGADDNAVTLLDRSGRESTLDRMAKEDLAGPIWDFIAESRTRTE
ncbi:bifunctional phosphopantothenoylcysteine decarboxylase/phosphopantothenate--cysteine ligase CoaBC [Candidatus Sumerlaeota bacterium]|nr:bifunctional phosphopantothenoylcysteine decarboxylase/phosphopantothenate--cysteine ligase CoaBC [Candidatus Sumerlaeota bacterium]